MSAVEVSKSAAESTAEYKMPTKVSAGIILCRKNETGPRPSLEVLLVLKRYTYAFAEFAHGRYTFGRPMPGIVPPPRTVPELLNDMTREELLIIWSLDFNQIWYKIWLTFKNVELFTRKNAKFQATFMRDGGELLQQYITVARAKGTILWEIPKGRRSSARESDIICGLRETREETGIDPREYRLLPDVNFRTSYISGDVRYTCAYQVALAYPRLAKSEQNCVRWLSLLRTIHQMAEVGEVRWCNIEQVRLIDSKRLAPLVEPAFRLVKKYIGGRWAFRQHGRNRLCNGSHDRPLSQSRELSCETEGPKPAPLLAAHAQPVQFVLPAPKLDEQRAASEPRPERKSEQRAFRGRGAIAASGAASETARGGARGARGGARGRGAYRGRWNTPRPHIKSATSTSPEFAPDEGWHTVGRRHRKMSTEVDHWPSRA